MNPVLNAQQFRDLDLRIMRDQNLSSIDLMERAAMAFVNRLFELFVGEVRHVFIFCGPGNNGGDGLAIARLLGERDVFPELFILPSKKYSADFEINLARLIDHGITPQSYDGNFPMMESDAIIIDALFGTGLARPLKNEAAHLIHQINNSGVFVVSVDIPSGMFCDSQTDGPIVKATETLTFNFPKLTFFLPQTGESVGEFDVLNIGVDDKYFLEIESEIRTVDESDLSLHLNQRKTFSHKGDFGHALIIAGSKSKTGAAILCSTACMRSGVGKLTVHLPSLSAAAMNVALPEAMVSCDADSSLYSTNPDFAECNAVAIGPGIGTNEKSKKAFEEFLRTNKLPAVIDADGLNLLGLHPELLQLIDSKYILTPHPGEFRRLVGDWENDFEKLEKLKNFSREHQCVVVLKGAFTVTTNSSGQLIFNTTGNPCLAKAGSGDVLTGVVLALLARGYSQFVAAWLGALIHGMAADKAAEVFHEDSVLATDICLSISAALNHDEILFKEFMNRKNEDKFPGKMF